MVSNEGEWKNDLYHGKGKQFYPEGTDVDLVSAEGDYLEGYRHGNGRLNYLVDVFKLEKLSTIGKKGKVK